MIANSLFSGADIGLYEAEWREAGTISQCIAATKQSLIVYCIRISFFISKSLGYPSPYGAALFQ